MPEAKFLFVINPISGDIEKDDLQDEIRSFMEGRNMVTKFFHTTGENDKQKILDKIEELQPDTVVAAGGDGTINLVAQTIISQPVKMGSCLWARQTEWHLSLTCQQAWKPT